MEKPNDATLEVSLSHDAAGEYEAELRFTSPARETEIPPVRGEIRLDFEELLDLQGDPEAYGVALTQGLFVAEELRHFYAQVRTAVDAGGLNLRLRLRTLVPAIHALRWELLREPGATNDEPGIPLAASERVLFSRFMASTDWRTVRVSRKSELRATLAVAAPSNLEAEGLAEIDAAAEVERAREALGGETLRGVELKVAGVDEPLTLQRLTDLLRDSPDIFYLVAHGALSRRSGEPALYLQKDDGSVAVCRGRELAERIAEMERPPRLVVLVSCESAGQESGSATSAQAALAPRLADAGVAAVLAMQGRISMPTMEEAMPVFFRELLRDGQIDRALAVARSAVRGRPDAWMPALFMRLKRGRIWYEPGFSGDESDFSQWRSLTNGIARGNFVPVLGTDISEHVFGSSREIAHHLSDRLQVPLVGEHRASLPKVTQFVSVEESRELAREGALKSLHKGLARRLDGADTNQPLTKLLDTVVERQADSDPLKVLAELPAPVYVNACRDPLLIKSLKAAGKTPRPLLCDWRPNAENHPRAPEFDDEPTMDAPVVHHMFGVLGKANSLVLTEDDFFDYMIAAAQYELIPPVVSGALTRGSLLFLGFQLDSWTFRVLFRLIMAMEGRQRLHQFAHVGVQVDPESSGMEDAESARRYLERYFTAGSGAPPVSIYWGSARDFLEELQQKMLEDDTEMPMNVEEDEDDWLS